MRRLLHRDLKSWVRSLQMSEHTLYIVVEGRESDRYFYGKLARHVCSRRGLSHWTVLPSEVPIDDQGKAWRGKAALVKAHELLRLAGTLSSNLGEKKTAIAFFADKDIDELLRGDRIVRSSHFIYTKFYDVEAHIVASGDVIGGAAASASIDEHELAAVIPNADNWRQGCADLWKEWIKICILCERYEAKGIANYHYESKVNAPVHGPVDAGKVKGYVEKLKASLSLTEEAFEKAYAIICRLVDRLYGEDRFLEIFKGKWFVNFMEHTLTQHGIEFKKTSLHAGMIGVISHSLDPTRDWALHFTTKLDALLD
jgi:hypothetical protein